MAPKVFADPFPYCTTPCRVLFIITGKREPGIKGSNDPTHGNLPGWSNESGILTPDFSERNIFGAQVS